MKRGFPNLRVVLSIALLLAATYSASQAQDERSVITGTCHCDTSSHQTICQYTVLSGRPALSHFIFPIPQNCLGRFTFSSSYFTNILGPELFSDRFCGDIFGIKVDQGLLENQVATFTMTWEGVCSTGVGLVYAALKGGTQCEIYPVPGVVDCPDIPCISWSLDMNAFEFAVKKTGTFAAKLATMTVESDYPVAVDFESFGNLLSVRDPASDWIPAFYATSPESQEAPPAQFFRPDDFNLSTILIPAEKPSYAFSLWTKIIVSKEVPACEYGDVATIVLTLENHQPTIDFNSGDGEGTEGR